LIANMQSDAMFSPQFQILVGVLVRVKVSKLLLLIFFVYIF